MGPDAVRYGDLEIHALPEGRFTVGTDKRFVPHTEGDPPRPGTLFISVTPFLVRAPGETLLLDAGLGAWAAGRGTEVVAENLARHGVDTARVDRVILSHLHADHVGGLVTPVGADWRPTFPRAEVVVQRAETLAPYTGESARAREIALDVLDREGQLVLVDGDAALGRAQLTVTGGHTPAHQAVRIASGELAAVFAGDVVGTAGQATRRFVAKYDHDGEQSAAWRARIAADAAEHGHLLLFYHSPGAPAAFLAEGPRGGYAAEAVDL